MSLLKGGAGYLGRVAERCQWVDVAGLIADAGRMRAALEELGQERMDQLDPGLIPRVRTVSAEQT